MTSYCCLKHDEIQFNTVSCPMCPLVEKLAAAEEKLNAAKLFIEQEEAKAAGNQDCVG